MADYHADWGGHRTSSKFQPVFVGAVVHLQFTFALARVWYDNSQGIGIMQRYGSIIKL